MTKLIITIISLLLFFSCKKSIEIREVQVDKKYSWTEIKRFTGTEKIFLSSGSSTDAIYLQQPYFFTEVRNQNINTRITVYGASLPTDIDIRIPIASNFLAFPFSDTVLRVINNLNPTVSPSGGYFDLKKIDPTLTYIQKYYNVLFKAMAINKNGALLLAYYNNRVSQPFTFMMLKIMTNSSYPYIDTLFSKSVSIPRTSIDAYVRHISAVNDYFLIDLSGNGLFKIKEDGTFNKIYNPATVDAFYEWQGKVYALAEGGRLLISSNNGEDWQEYSGITSSMTTSNYYVIKDSLVGVYRDNLFTLKWRGFNYTQRFLKNDGVEFTRINGVEVLRDSVYIATTSGLFAKPLSTFFEEK
jgi:hypothetical protein